MRKIISELYGLLLRASTDLLSQHYREHEGDLVEKAEVMCGLYNYIREQSRIESEGIIGGIELSSITNKKYDTDAYIVEMSVYNFIATVLYNTMPNNTPFLRTLGLMAIAVDVDEMAVHSLMFKCSSCPTSVWAGEEAYERICTPEFLKKFYTLYIALTDAINHQETELFG